jgi:ketol-acid reductoisomerase
MSNENIENTSYIPDAIGDMTDDELTGLVGATIYAGVRALVDQGMSPQMALRVVAAAYVTEALGPKALEDMGVPLSTAKRWRVQLREGAKNVPDEPPQRVLEDAQRYLEWKLRYG